MHNLFPSFLHFFLPSFLHFFISSFLPSFISSLLLYFLLLQTKCNAVYPAFRAFLFLRLHCPSFSPHSTLFCSSLLQSLPLIHRILPLLPHTHHTPHMLSHITYCTHHILLYSFISSITHYYMPCSASRIGP
jgi:hypothetical protein